MEPRIDSRQPADSHGGIPERTIKDVSSTGREESLDLRTKRNLCGRILDLGGEQVHRTVWSRLSGDRVG